MCKKQECLSTAQNVIIQTRIKFDHSEECVKTGTIKLLQNHATVPKRDLNF